MNTKKLKVLWPKAKKDLPTYLYKGQALCLYLLASRRASGENVSLEGEGLNKNGFCRQMTILNQCAGLMQALPSLSCSVALLFPAGCVVTATGGAYLA